MPHDKEPLETAEWLAAFESVLLHDGEQRANFLLQSLIAKARENQVEPVCALNTPYNNTIDISEEEKLPTTSELECKITKAIRWNAAMTVVRANLKDSSLGGHIGTYASASLLYEMGFNHFWRAPTEKFPGDLIFYQGHASPGMYARSFLEGRISEKRLLGFRQEAIQQGLSSYPHPWLMPDYWSFPTVSMGLGPLQAIYQARFKRYLEARGLIEKNDQKIWCFCGDGEMDEPESLGALSIAAREQCDNLIFVINCNLQRLDGPVRGNGKIIQELERLFLGAGWHVIKVIWGSNWQPLFEQDTDGILQNYLDKAVDGDFQIFQAKGGAYFREHFFGQDPALKAMVAHLSDEQLANLERGGHCPQKVYAAYHQAVNTTGKPVVILAKTIKGYGLGTAGEALNTAHNVKKMLPEEIKAFRDRLQVPVADKDIENMPFIEFTKDSEEAKFLKQSRDKLGGPLPARHPTLCKTHFKAPNLALFKNQLEGSGERKISTTMAYVRALVSLCRDKTIGKSIVPIIPDEARTFGMEGLFRQMGIYSSCGQLYNPVDGDQVMSYHETKKGQILEEGINEAGAFCSWLASATSYANHHVTTIPFYIYYSMFGFQRVGDLCWAAGDARARGFLIGATSGRTTLNGEGLQHQDGHSHVMAGTIPNCVSYDPTFAYELAVIIQHGLKRMLDNQEDVYYYITVTNENYTHPSMPKGVEDGILKGLYPLAPEEKTDFDLHLLGSGTILLEVIKAQELLCKDFNIKTKVWSAPSFNELGREGQACDHWNAHHPEEKSKVPYVSECLAQGNKPVLVATDYVKEYPEQIRPFLKNRYKVLGTNGFGRSDSRENLRQHFEVDSKAIAYHAVLILVEEGKLERGVLKKAFALYKMNEDKPNPFLA